MNEQREGTDAAPEKQRSELQACCQCRIQNTFAGICKSMFGKGKRAGEGVEAAVGMVLRYLWSRLAFSATQLSAPGRNIMPADI
jgi:hypothetical protein